MLGRSLQAWVVGKYVVRKKRTWPTMILFPITGSDGDDVLGAELYEPADSVAG